MKAFSIEIVDKALSLKLLSFRSSSKWPVMISRWRTDHNIRQAGIAMAPPVLRYQHVICPLPMQFACDRGRVLLPAVRRDTNVATDKCSALLDWHIDIELFSRNNPYYKLYMACKGVPTMWIGYRSRGLANCAPLASLLRAHGHCVSEIDSSFTSSTALTFFLSLTWCHGSVSGQVRACCLTLIRCSTLQLLHVTTWCS